MIKTEKIVTYTCDICEQAKQRDEISSVALDVTPHAAHVSAHREADVCADCIGSLTVVRLLGPAEPAQVTA